MNTKPSASAPKPSRRRFLRQTLAATSLGTLAGPTLANAAVPPRQAAGQLPPAFDKLAPLGTRVHPITPAEFSERIEHAQRVMADPKIAGR